MQLSPAEGKELEEAYQITLSGFDNYFRRKHVLNFFSEFDLPATSLPVFNYDTGELDDKESSFLDSSAEVKQALFHIISVEMSKKENGYIRLLIQPEDSFLLNLISAEYPSDKDIHIEHIICLNNNPDTIQIQKNYNLNCLKHILPLYGSCRNYECFYYYDDISSKTGKFSLFPYMVITSRYVCLLNSSLNRGIVMFSDEAHRMFSEIFTEYLQLSTLLLNHIDSAVDQLDYVENLIRRSGTGYSFQMTPCFTPFITPANIEKYTIRNIPFREQFIKCFCKYTKEVAAWYEQENVFCLFSYDGVRRFLKSGKIDEYPADICLPFDMPDRINLIKKLICSCKKIHYRMLKKDIGKPAHGLYLFVTRQDGYLMFTSPYNGHPVYLNIEEPGLLFTFFDFCENLDDNMFYTIKETEDLLNDLIK